MSDLSICMMVKDGGKLFAQALESIRGFDAHVVVLVDNATTDNTVEIAQNFGAQVEYHDWPDDFAEARNRSLKFAERKWTLILDHDERYEPADIPRMIDVLEAEVDNEGIRITTLSESGAGGTSAAFIPRFIMTGFGRYIGAKHHALVIAGNVRYAPGRIYHKGYNLSPRKMKEKNERDLKLLWKQIEEEPHESYHRRNLIRSLRSAGDMDELLKQAQELDDLVQNFQIPITDLSQQLVMLDVGSAHLTNGDYEQAEVILSQLTREFPHNPDGWFYLGCCQHSQEKFAEAGAALSNYVQVIYVFKTNQNPPSMMIETWGSITRAYTIMADAYLESGQIDQYKQAQMAAFMQMNQDFISSFSGREISIIKNLQAEIHELKNPKTQLITL